MKSVGLTDGGLVAANYFRVQNTTGTATVTGTMSSQTSVVPFTGQGDVLGTPSGLVVVAMGLVAMFFSSF